jgi:TolB protein
VVQIAYVGSDGHVYVAEADGTGARPLSQTVAGLSGGPGWIFRWPTYSPDGRRIAFGGYRTQAGDLLSGAVLSADVGQARGATSTLLESAALSPIYLYWAPDSRHLTALVQRSNDLVLYLLDAEAREQPRELLVGNPLYWSWAPDGRSLAIHLGGDAHASPDAWVGLLHVDETGVREERFIEGPGEFRAPAWSPDGRLIVFERDFSSTNTKLFLMNANGTAQRRLTDIAEAEFHPAWSPDGTRIVFSESHGGASQIAIVNLDGGGFRPLTSGQSQNLVPEW